MGTPLYRTFTTTKELDAQYDVEATVADFGAYVLEFVRNSKRARESLKCTLDVAYGPTVDEVLDIFYPDDPGNDLKPAVFFIHGGFWKATTNKEWSYVAEGLAKLGVVTVLENYSLCPDVSVAEIVRQHRAAYAYIWNNAEKHGIDRNRIILIGHSVGGHAVAELLSTQWESKYRMPAHPYAGAIAISGLFDVRPIPHTFAGPLINLSVADAELLSPILRIPTPGVPVLVTVGADETEEFIRQSADYAAACKQERWAVETQILAKNHFDILDEFMHGEGEMINYLLRILR